MGTEICDRAACQCLGGCCTCKDFENVAPPVVSVTHVVNTLCRRRVGRGSDAQLGAHVEQSGVSLINKSVLLHLSRIAAGKR